MDSTILVAHIRIMSRSILRIVPGAFQQSAAGLRSIDRFSRDLPIEPFLVFTEFEMDRPVFGPHPHAGMSVLTYVLPDSAGGFLNRDSFGDHSRIEPGGAHATQAGAGIMHDEVPLVTGTICHGMQIWINHSVANRFVPPAALHAAPDAIPTVSLDAGSLRVVLGEFRGVRSPIRLVTDVMLFDVTLPAFASVSLDAPAMACAHLFSGSLASDQAINAHDMVLFAGTTDSVQLTAGPSGAHLLFAAGTPHDEPIAFGGPFVGTTEADLRDLRLRFSRGQMGALAPV